MFEFQLVQPLKYTRTMHFTGIYYNRALAKYHHFIQPLVFMME